jgi:hypothetical protein
MEQLLLINPRGRTKKHHRRRAKNSRRRTRRAAGGYRIRRSRIKNPRSRHHKHRSRRRNPIMRRRRHRNPSTLGGIKSAVMPALLGAAGGVAVDYAFQFAAPYLPTSLTTGAYTVPIAKLGVAFGLGLLAKKFLGGDKGNAVMAGALAIQTYNLLATVLGGTSGLAGLSAYMPKLSGMGSPNPATYLNGPRMGKVGRVGAYMPRMSGLSGLGGLNGAPLAGAGSDYEN